MSIAVSFAEFAVLRTLQQFLTPRLMGFGEVREVRVSLALIIWYNRALLRVFFRSIGEVFLKKKLPADDCLKEEDSRGAIEMTTTLLRGLRLLETSTRLGGGVGDAVGGGDV